MRSDPCPRRQMSPTDSPAPKRRVIFAVLLPMVLSLIVLPAIAFARPPDSAWIGGIYDGADGDDSVVLVYETAAPSVPNEPPPPLFCCLQNISIESTVHGLLDGRFTRSVRSPLSALGSPIPSLVLNNHEYRIRRAPDQSRSAVVVSQPVVDRRRTPVRVLLITDRDLA